MKNFSIRHHYDLTGSEFHYTTHGFTLISAALEGASGHTFPSMVQELFAEIGMTASGLDDKQRLLYHRARYVKTMIIIIMYSLQYKTQI